MKALAAESLPRDASSRASPDASPTALYVLFLLSGFAGLVYQVMWTRGFSLVFGGTTQAASAVLASFFAGLALGSWLGARLADRRSAALGRYGYAELAIAAGALLVPLWLTGFRVVYPSLYQSGGGEGPALTAFKLLLAFAAMGPPCVAMGTTLPLITRALVSLPGHFGRRAGVAYALNTLGATTGVLLAGFVLPPRIGTTNSIYAAACVSILVGVAAILLSRRWRRGPESASSGGEDLDKKQAPAIDRWLWLVVAVSGFGTLALEVLYTRLIVMQTDGSVFSFALILATFLVFLALASLGVSASIDRLRSPWKLIAWTQALAAIAILVSPRVFQLYGIGARPAPGPMSGFVVQSLVLSAVIMGPTVLLVGVALPTAWKIATRSAGESGRNVGRLTGLNTLAGVVGSVAAGFVLLPALGVGRSIALVAALYALLALTGFLRGYSRAIGLVAGASIALILAGLHSFGLSRATPLQLRPGESPIRVIEGEAATIAVTEDAHQIRRLWLNNTYLLGSSFRRAVEVQRVQGGLPLVLHPRPRSVAFIGLATGSTASSVLEFPVERVLAMELVPGVVSAAADFEAANRGVLRDPRVETLIADGRNHLFATRETFDVIVGDLFVPAHAGTGYLYTREHFRNVKARLAPGGLFAQWLPGHQLSAEQIRIIAATFQDAFPKATLWWVRTARRLVFLALVGARDDEWVPGAAERRAVEGSEVFPGLAFVGGPELLREWSASALRNSDEFPRIEFLAAANRFAPKASQMQEVRRLVDRLRRGG